MCGAVLTMRKRPVVLNQRQRLTGFWREVVMWTTGKPLAASTDRAACTAGVLGVVAARFETGTAVQPSAASTGRLTASRRHIGIRLSWPRWWR